MDANKAVMGLLLAMLMLLAMAQGVSAAYSANYTISDLPSIIVDTIAKFIVAFQPNIQNVTDLLVLGLVISLIGSAVLGLVVMFSTLWGKFGGKKKMIG